MYYAFLFLFLFPQIKSFLRVDCVCGGSTPTAVSVLVPHLEEHLHKMDISFNRDLLRGITKIFPGMSRSGVLRTFLAVGSQLKDIPKGIKGRKASGTVYQRCTEINAEAFETSTLETLTEG